MGCLEVTCLPPLFDQCNPPPRHPHLYSLHSSGFPHLFLPSASLRCCREATEQGHSRPNKPAADGRSTRPKPEAHASPSAADPQPSKATPRKASGAGRKGGDGGNARPVKTPSRPTAASPDKRAASSRRAVASSPGKRQGNPPPANKKDARKPPAPPGANGVQKKKAGNGKTQQRTSAKVDKAQPKKQQPRKQGTKDDAADKKRRRERDTSLDPSSSDGPSAPQGNNGGGGGLKRVRSAWRMRPLIVDEKLRVYVEGRDDEMLHYDGGEFYAWLKDCEQGKADPADGFSYPLVVQDSDLRTLLEIKGPEPGATAAQAGPSEKRRKVAGPAPPGIKVPTWRVLPAAEVPDRMIASAGKTSSRAGVKRTAGDPDTQAHGGPDTSGRPSAAAAAAAAAWRSAEAALASDPPYFRYVQPTPDDLDLAIEYDLDDEDEDWLEEHNKEAKRSKVRHPRQPLSEEGLEHLMDRMEKEYTHELQRHPEKWVVGFSGAAGGGGNGKLGRPGGGGDGAIPTISVPSIDEIFPLERCMEVPGMRQYEGAVPIVYSYWKAKHERAGRPLIQRLWYEPPWDRKAAARRVAADGEDSPDGVFTAHDSPLALVGIRKRRMDAAEVRSRFEAIRRDLEAARTLADQVRRREKLKRREAQLLKEEWAARMQGAWGKS